MKRVFSILLIPLMIAIFSSCGLMTELPDNSILGPPVSALPDDSAPESETGSITGDNGIGEVSISIEGVADTAISNFPVSNDPVNNDSVSNDSASNDSVSNDSASNDSVSNNSVSNDLVIHEINMEIFLFFSDNKAIADGAQGPYRFVSPVKRTVAATSGILKAAMDELINGPLPEDEGAGPVIPGTVKLLSAIIKDRIVCLDFNKALESDHAGGTLGGAVTMQAIVFTACQFDSIDGVMITVEGKPWSDGHFNIETPVYAKDLYLGEGAIYK